MTTPALIIGLAILGFVAFSIWLSRQSSDRKRKAIASLEAEKEQVGSLSVLDLAKQEVQDLGLRSIPGGDALSTEILLKVWRRSEGAVRDCRREDLRYIVELGAVPADATADQVTLICDPPGQEATDPPADGTPPVTEPSSDS